MIEMISGVTRVGNRTYSPADGVVALGNDVEKRLIATGVARRVYPDTETEQSVHDAPQGSDSVPDAGQYATPPDAESVTEDEETPDVAAEAENDGAEAEREQADFYDRDYLASLTKAQLEEIADKMGIDTSAMRRKADFVEAILNQQAADSGEAADDEEPPDLGAEGPVS